MDENSSSNPSGADGTVDVALARTLMGQCKAIMQGVGAAARGNFDAVHSFTVHGFISKCMKPVGDELVLAAGAALAEGT